MTKKKHTALSRAKAEIRCLRERIGILERQLERNRPIIEAIDTIAGRLECGGGDYR